MAAWKPVGGVLELAPSANVPPPAMPARPSTGSGRGQADEIDYRIVGGDMQFVEIELDPGESAISEAGALMYKDSAVQMDTVFGDGSHAGQDAACSTSCCRPASAWSPAKACSPPCSPTAARARRRSRSPRPTPARCWR